MTHRSWTMPALALALGLAATAFAQDAGNPPPPPPMMGPGGPPMGRMAPDAVRETLNALGDLNLSPGFTLDAAQKEKIQTLREQFKKVRDQWQTAHRDDLKKLDDQMRDLRDNGGGPEDFQQIGQARRKIMDTAPKGDDVAKQIVAVLTEDQGKQLAAKLQELKAQRQDMGPPPGMGGPGGPGGPDGGFGPPPGDNGGTAGTRGGNTGQPRGPAATQRRGPAGGRPPAN